MGSPFVGSGGEPEPEQLLGDPKLAHPKLRRNSKPFTALLAHKRGEVRVQGRTCNPNPEIWEFEILAPSKFRDVEIPRFQQMSEIWEM